jgi:hypothetical protein
MKFRLTLPSGRASVLKKNGTGLYEQQLKDKKVGI